MDGYIHIPLLIVAIASTCVNMQLEYCRSRCLTECGRTMGVRGAVREMGSQGPTGAHTAKIESVTFLGK